MRVIFCTHCGKPNHYDQDKEPVKKSTETAAPGQCTENTLRAGRWSFPNIEHQYFFVPQHILVGETYRIASNHEFPFWLLCLQEGQRLNVPIEIAQKIGCDDIVKNANLHSIGDKCLLELIVINKNLLTISTCYGDISIKECTQW